MMTNKIISIRNYSLKVFSIVLMLFITTQISKAQPPPVPYSSITDLINGGIGYYDAGNQYVAPTAPSGTIFIANPGTIIDVDAFIDASGGWDPLPFVVPQGCTLAGDYDLHSVPFNVPGYGQVNTSPNGTLFKTSSHRWTWNNFNKLDSRVFVFKMEPGEYTDDNSLPVCPGCTTVISNLRIKDRSQFFRMKMKACYNIPTVPHAAFKRIISYLGVHERIRCQNAITIRSITRAEKSIIFHSHYVMRS